MTDLPPSSLPWPCCPTCDQELVTVECRECEGAGNFHDDDGVNDWGLAKCTECNGKGTWLVCERCHPEDAER